MMPQEALEKKVWAVIGATARTEKFGYKIYKHLRDHGYTVYPVNPNVTAIDGDVCYPSLRALPEVPQVVDFVVSERVGLEAVDECQQLGVEIAWLQPGADTSAVITKANDAGLAVITDCVLVQLK